VLALALGVGGCALTSKGEPLNVRWFDPETVRPRLTSATLAAGPAAPPAPAIELGRVTSGLDLREKIAYRDSAYEVGFYDDKRWTERPEVYVRRELGRTLYEERGIRRPIGGSGPILDVEVLSFEELRGPARAARIRLRMLIHDDRTTLLERTLTIDRPLRPGAKGFDAVVQAMAEALASAAEEVATETELVLRSQPPNPERP
jgi:cholesterol transport system auxiliary component